MTTPRPPQSSSSESTPPVLKVDYRTNGSFMTDYGRQLSERSVFVATSMPLEEGQELRVRLSLPKDPYPFAVDAVVAKTFGLHDEPHEPGMKLRFINLSPEAKQNIRDLLGRCEGYRAR